DRFASEEGPRLVQDAGKFGVRAFFPTIDRLSSLMRRALIPAQDPAGVPAGYRTARVQRSLEELAGHLDDLKGRAQPFASNRPPAGAFPRNGAAMNGFARAAARTGAVAGVGAVAGAGTPRGVAP